ncbi:MAG: hypothetical protein N2110_04700 [Flavobacteriales bacterium]|nr:hypothetical protein [Flavobacteriales bacterium]MCX7768308.1 hypothetical protein [Flavobacteriales bacterium]MDW8409936.1 hypothetical protein [Flavobacteriales bacterium]
MSPAGQRLVGWPSAALRIPRAGISAPLHESASSSITYEIQHAPKAELRFFGILDT